MLLIDLQEAFFEAPALAQAARRADLLLRMRNLEVGQVVMAGVSTHACIAQTARDAYAHNVRASIVTDAVADERRDHKDMILEQLAHDRQAQLASLEEIRERWAPAPAR